MDERLKVCNGEITALRAEVNLKKDELKQLLKSVDALHYKVRNSSKPLC